MGKDDGIDAGPHGRRPRRTIDRAVPDHEQVDSL